MPCVGSLTMQHINTLDREMWRKKLWMNSIKDGGKSCHVLFYGTRHLPGRREENKEKKFSKGRIESWTSPGLWRILTNHEQWLAVRSGKIGLRVGPTYVSTGWIFNRSWASSGGNAFRRKVKCIARQLMPKEKNSSVLPRIKHNAIMVSDMLQLG